VDFEEAKQQSRSIREDRKKSHWLHHGRAEMYRRHDAVLRAQRIWDERGTAGYYGEGWQMEGLLNRLPRPNVHLAQTKINGRWIL